jgi:hypothetical protein
MMKTLLILVALALGATWFVKYQLSDIQRYMRLRSM